MSIWKNGKLVAGGRQCMPLLSFMWADHQLNDISWLRADTFSWQNGSVYQAAYQHLADDIDGKTLQSETIGSTTIQFYLADDGHKICPASEESNVMAIYNATGVAWYYIIDTTNERFKLPRAKPLNGAIAGNGIALGITDGTTNYGGRVYSTALRANEASYGAKLPSNDSSVNYIADEHRWGITTDSSKSGIIAERDNTDQHKYLYFYVGTFTQTALENTAGITAETLNDKVDKGHQVIEFQAPTAGNNYTWYRLYADGWVEQGGSLEYTSGYDTSVVFPITMADTRYTAFAQPWNSGSYPIVIQNKTTTGFDLTGNVGKDGWQVSGMAA